MRTLEQYPNQNGNIALFDRQGKLIFGHNQLANEKTKIFHGVDFKVFCGYLLTHFPNYRAVRALRLASLPSVTLECVTSEQLEAVSDSVPMTVGDVEYLLDFQKKINEK
jgi:hypothetical protein